MTRWLTLAISIGLGAVGGCKHERFQFDLPSQDSADQKYVLDSLARACDGGKEPRSRPYQAGTGKHAVALCEYIDQLHPTWACNPVLAGTPHAIAEADLIACVRSTSGGLAPTKGAVSLVATATGAEVTHLDLEYGSHSSTEAATTAVAGYLAAAPPSSK